MSNGREFQRTEAATGNERRPTVEKGMHEPLMAGEVPNGKNGKARSL